MKLPANLLKVLTRLFPIERGKFRILTEVYFRYFAPNKPTVVTTQLSYGIRMEIDITEFLQAHLFLFGSYELPTVKFIRSLIRAGDTAFDVGAQIGYLSLAIATLRPGHVSVFSFEPEEKNLDRLRKNVSLNPGVDVKIIERAVSDTNGSLKLYLSKDHNAGTHSTIAGSTNVSDLFIEIPCVTVDEFVRENNISALRLMKVDVEGGELEVIRGALNTLTTLKPILILEMSDALQEARGFSTIRFKEMLADIGYDSYTLRDDGSLLQSSMNCGHAMENVVFVHRDQQDA